MVKHTAKQVVVSEALLEKYKPEDIVHYVTVELQKTFNFVQSQTVEGNDSGVILGELLVNVGQAIAYLKAADEALNKVDKDPTIAL